MPISYSINTDKNLVLTKAWEEISESELIAHKKKLMSDSHFKPGMKELSDCRQVTKFNISPDGIRTLVFEDAKDADRLKNYAMALVVNSDFGFGLARMYEIKSEEINPNVAVFKSMEEAMEWLGIES